MAADGKGNEILRAVSDYCGYFRERVDKIDAVTDSLHAKLLTATILDALAGGRYPDKKNRERFLDLISGYAKWDACNRVSPIQYKLHVKQLPENGNVGEVTRLLSRIAHEIRDNCEREQFRSIEQDPLVSTLVAMHPTSEEVAILKQTTHLALLYAYRNQLVHEFKEPGYGFEFDDSGTEPFYFVWGQVGEEIDPDPPQLTYTRRWWLSIARTVIGELEAYYRENTLDPYQRHRFGSLWTRNRPHR